MKSATDVVRVTTVTRFTLRERIRVFLGARLHLTTHTSIAFNMKQGVISQVTDIDWKLILREKEIINELPNPTN